MSDTLEFNMVWESDSSDGTLVIFSPDDLRSPWGSKLVLCESGDDSEEGLHEHEIFRSTVYESTSDALASEGGLGGSMVCGDDLFEVVRM